MLAVVAGHAPDLGGFIGGIGVGLALYLGCVLIALPFMFFRRASGV